MRDPASMCDGALGEYAPEYRTIDAHDALSSRICQFELPTRTYGAVRLAPSAHGILDRIRLRDRKQRQLRGRFDCASRVPRRIDFRSDRGDIR